LVEKWIPPSRSETAKIGQKTEGILGVKCYLSWEFWQWKAIVLIKQCSKIHNQIKVN
jgi:hypothetical protein